MERASKVTDLAATVTKIDGLDYRTIDPDGGEWDPTVGWLRALPCPASSAVPSAGLITLQKRTGAFHLLCPAPPEAGIYSTVTWEIGMALPPLR